MARPSGSKKQEKTITDIVYLSIQLLILFIFFASPNLYYYGLPKIWVGIGIIIAGIGFLLGLISSLTLGNALSPYVTPAPKGKLITHGVYRFMRHPLYAGILAILLGLTLVFFALSKIMVFLIAIIFFYKKASYEEKILIERYPEYKAYKQKTGKFWPKLNY